VIALRISHRVARLIGYRRLFVFGVGLALGLLLAPVPGHELRAALKRRLESRRAGSDPQLAERVRFELAHHPRTWHLPQPHVSVEHHRVILAGEVPDDAARQEFVRAASALAGVAEVDDRLTAPGTTPAR
jgi:hypothetical protein